MWERRSASSPSSVEARGGLRATGGRELKRATTTILLVGLLATSAGATEIFEKVGTVGVQFLKIGVGARAAAMGEAFTPVADDATALYWNPAGIARIEGNQVSLNHASWPADIGHEFVGSVF